MREIGGDSNNSAYEGGSQPIVTIVFEGTVMMGTPTAHVSISSYRICERE